MQKFNLIFLRSNKVLVSQKQYFDWKGIQNEFDDYLTNVGFNSIDEIKEHIQFDYKLTEEKAIKESRKITESNSEYVEIEL
jgi:thermostable 8-oxoguanine DNA glycosylase